MDRLKSRFIFLIEFIVISIAFFALFNQYYNDQKPTVKVQLEINTNKDEQYSIYYDTIGNQQWNEINKDIESYTEKNRNVKLNYVVPEDSKNIRIDFGDQIKSVKLISMKVCRNGDLNYRGNELGSLFTSSNSSIINVKNKLVIVKCNGQDPYAVISNFDKIANKVSGRPSYVNFVLVTISLVSSVIATNSLRGLKKSIIFVRQAISNRGLIVNLAKNDFKQKYVSSYLGVIWGFIQPLITILVYWFVFQVALKNGSVDNIPFILWFIPGIVPWFFFSEALSACSNVFIEYSYLVKKVVFKIEALPVIKIISILFVQCFFIGFVMIICCVYKYYPDIYQLQVIYYLFAMIVLVYSISVFTSAVILFFRDLGQIIGIIINVGFWATPIGWNITILPVFLQRIMKLNPMFYIVNGYRDAFVQKVFFFERPYDTIYFWLFCTIMLLVGIKVFNKLRPHFSDVI